MIDILKQRSQIFKIIFLIVFAARIPALFGALTDVDVAIIGGGLSGIRLAELWHKNYKGKMEIFEARNHLGGRAHTEFINGSPVEFGGEYIDAGHTAIRRRAAELSIPLEPVSTSGLVVFFDEQILTPAETNALLMSTILKLTHVARENSGQNTWSYFTPHERAFLNVLTRDEMGIDLDRSIALTPKFLLDKMRPQEFVFDTSSSPTPCQYRVKGGTKILIDAMASNLPQGTIHLNQPLKKLSREGENYHLLFEDGQTVTAHTVFMSLPFSVLHSTYGILDDKSLGINPEFRKIIDGTPYGTNAKMIIQTQQPVSFMYGVNLKTSLSYEANPVGATTIFGGTTGEIVDPENVCAFFPEIYTHLNVALREDCPPLLKNWFKDPYSRGSWSTTTNDQPFSSFNSVNPASGLKVFATALAPQGLYFIGEHANNFSAHMNDAIESANKAMAFFEQLHDLSF